MIQSLMHIKRRMRSIENTRKITRAMEMVSASKLNRCRAALLAARPFYLRLEATTRDFLAHAGTVAHPFLAAKGAAGRICICVITSDAGLCGIYNQAIIRAVDDFAGRYDRDAIAMVTVGKEGFAHFSRRGYTILRSYPEMHGRYSDAAAGSLAADLIALFTDGSADEVYVGHTHFDAMLRYKPKVQKVLQIDYTPAPRADYLIEPDREQVAAEILPRYFREKIRLIMLDAFTAEHASRTIAMKTAKDNAEDLIGALTLMRNKARQAAITKEVIEIASAAEALKG